MSVGQTDRVLNQGGLKAYVAYTPKGLSDNACLCACIDCNPIGVPHLGVCAMELKSLEGSCPQ